MKRESQSDYQSYCNMYYNPYDIRILIMVDRSVLLNLLLMLSEVVEMLLVEQDKQTDIEDIIDVFTFIFMVLTIILKSCLLNHLLLVIQKSRDSNTFQSGHYYQYNHSHLGLQECRQVCQRESNQFITFIRGIMIIIGVVIQSIWLGYLFIMFIMKLLLVMFIFGVIHCIRVNEQMMNREKVNEQIKNREKVNEQMKVGVYLMIQNRIESRLKTKMQIGLN